MDVCFRNLDEETAGMSLFGFSMNKDKITLLKMVSGTVQNIATFTADEDTGWQTLTDGIQYRKKNGIVFLDIQGVTVNNPATWATIGTLPAGFRPSTRVNTTGQASGMSSPCGLMVNVGGQIQVMRFGDMSSNLTGVHAWTSFPV